MNEIVKKFKTFQGQIELKGESGEDGFFTGNLEDVIPFLEEHEDLEISVTEHEEYFSAEDAAGSYWGSGRTAEDATRYLIGALLTESAGEES